MDSGSCYDGRSLLSDRSMTEEDDGLCEASRFNSSVQRIHAALRLPEVWWDRRQTSSCILSGNLNLNISIEFLQVYHYLGLAEPPKCFTPPDIELYTRSMRIIEVDANMGDEE